MDRMNRIASVCSLEGLAMKGLSTAKVHLLWVAALLFTVALLPNKSFAHNTAAGCGASTTPITLSDENNWATLCSTTIDLTDGAHDCVATASAEVGNTVSDVHNEYRFTLATIKNPSTGLEAERVVDINQDVNSADPIQEEISTVRHFSLAAGKRTFFWLARPFNSSADNIDVTSYSMGIVCTDGK